MSLVASKNLICPPKFPRELLQHSWAINLSLIKPYYAFPSFCTPDKLSATDAFMCGILGAYKNFVTLDETQPLLLEAFFRGIRARLAALSPNQSHSLGDLIVYAILNYERFKTSTSFTTIFKHLIRLQPTAVIRCTVDYEQFSRWDSFTMRDLLPFFPSVNPKIPLESFLNLIVGLPDQARFKIDFPLTDFLAYIAPEDRSELPLLLKYSDLSMHDLLPYMPYTKIG
jgi:hypothetical protein